MRKSSFTYIGSSAVALFLVLVPVKATGQNDVSDRLSVERTVRRAFDEVSDGMRYSWTERRMARLGDSAAPEIMKCVSSEPLTRKNIGTALSLVKMSFAQDSSNRQGANGIPSNTLVLLDFLDGHVRDTESDLKSTIHSLREQFQNARAALDELIARLGSERTREPDPHSGVAPFLTCSPSGQQVLSLMVEDPEDSSNASVQVSARNTTDKTLALILSALPSGTFPVTVVSPDGENAKPIKPSPERERRLSYTFYVVLPPHVRVLLWRWNFGGDFDASTPGTYRVSAGGPLPYLGTTVCSNVFDVVVK